MTNARLLAFSVAVLTVGCGGSVPALHPRLGTVETSVHLMNPLAVGVSYSATAGSCVRATFAAAGEPPQSTQCRPAADTRGSLDLLGLSPSTHYTGTLELLDSGGAAVASAPLDFTSGALPLELQGVHLAVTGDLGGGYVLTGLNLPLNAPSIEQHGYALAFDGAGQLRWMRAFPLAVVETKQQANGDFTTFVGSTRGWDPGFGQFMQYTPGGEMVQAWSTPAPLHTDDHELLLSFDSAGAVAAAHYFAYSLVELDVDGAPVELALHSLIRQKPDGSTETVYDSTRDVSIEDEVAGTGIGDLGDVDHPNSLDFDTDGNYIASFRSLSEVVKIDARSGAVLWRLGGKRNEFTFVDDPDQGFSGQHSVRVLPGGHLLVYDNGWRRTPAQTRVVEYAIDVPARTATRVWQYDSGAFTPYMGSAQRLENGDTFVGLASGEIVEVDAAGQRRFDARLLVGETTQSVLYRAVRVPSLEEYVKP